QVVGPGKHGWYLGGSRRHEDRDPRRELSRGHRDPQRQGETVGHRVRAACRRHPGRDHTGHHHVSDGVSELGQGGADPQVVTGEAGRQDQYGHGAHPGKRAPAERRENDPGADEHPQDGHYRRQNPPGLAACPLDRVHYFARSTSPSFTLAPVRKTARSYTLAPANSTASTARTMSPPDAATSQIGTSVAAIRTGITIEENGGIHDTTVARVPVGSRVE